MFIILAGSRGISWSLRVLAIPLARNAPTRGLTTVLTPEDGAYLPRISPRSWDVRGDGSHALAVRIGPLPVIVDRRR
jgi:hypothetical protein